MRWLAAFILGGVFVGSLVGGLAYRQRGTGEVAAAQAHESPTAGITWLDVRMPVKPAAGGKARLIGYQGGAVTLLVNQGAFQMQQRAYREHDPKTLGWVLRTYDSLDVPSQTPVKVLTIEDSGAHVEILEGAQAGRRGWVSPTSLAP